MIVNRDRCYVRRITAHTPRRCSYVVLPACCVARMLCCPDVVLPGFCVARMLYFPDVVLPGSCVAGCCVVRMICCPHVELLCCVARKFCCPYVLLPGCWVARMLWRITHLKKNNVGGRLESRLWFEFFTFHNTEAGDLERCSKGRHIIIYTDRCREREREREGEGERERERGDREGEREREERD